MAEDKRPQTEAEAQNKLVRKLEENASKLRKATAAGNRADIKKYWDEASRIETELRSVGTLGSIGSGLLSGVSGLATAIPDLVTGGLKAVGAVPEKTKALGQRLAEFSGFTQEPASDENALAYRMAQGAGSSVLGGGMKGLLTGTGLGAADVGVSAATDGMVPEGVVSGVYGLGALTKGAVRGIRNMAQDRRMQKFIDDLPTEEANKFKAYMLRGQGSPDATLDAAIQKLRTNPKYSELLATLETGATKAAIQGIGPTGRTSGTEQEATTGIITRIKAEMDGLYEKRQQAGNSLFETAKKYGADREIVDPSVTLANIRALKAEYAKKSTTNAEKAVEHLTSIEDKLTRGVVPRSIGVLGEPVVPREMPKMTIEQTQGLLSEYGKKAAAGDSLLKDLALSDEKRISAAIFGGLKDDLKASRIAAVTPEDKAATGILLQARSQIEKASRAYEDKLAQGLPAFLKDKSLNQIEYDTLYKEYKNLSPANRAAMREYVGRTDQEALNFIDKSVYTDFIASGKGKNLSGLEGTNLEELTSKWFSMGKNEKDALVTSLGTTAGEFEQRMKDAQIFNRRIGANYKGTEPLVDTGTQRAAAATVGSIAGYQGAKATELTIDALNKIKKTGFSDDQLAKMLFTKEGTDFLKSASMSKPATKVLDELTKFTSSQPSPESLSALSKFGATTVPTEALEAPTAPSDEFVMPPDVLKEFNLPETAPVEDNNEFIIPSDLMQGFRSGGEEKAAQAVGNIDYNAPQAQQDDAVAGIKQALQSGQLQGQQAAEAQALLAKLGL